MIQWARHEACVAMQRTAIGTFHCQIRCLSYVNLDGGVAVRTAGDEITGQSCKHRSSVTRRWDAS